MTLNRQRIQDALEAIPHPARRAGLVSSGAVIEVSVFAGSVRVVLGTPGLTPDQVSALTEAVERAVRGAGESSGEAVERIRVECVPRLKHCPSLGSLLVFGRPAWVQGTGCFADLTTPPPPPPHEAPPQADSASDVPVVPPRANDVPLSPPPQPPPQPPSPPDAPPRPGTATDPAP
jgi:hypothetical protein